MDEKLKFAVFFDYDNIEIGVKSTLSRELDIAVILEGVKQRGEIVSKVAYGNWNHHPEATRSFTEFGVQLVQRDTTPRGDKNGGDINLALDALEMAFTRDHINAFAIVSGDSDFMALVNKLMEYNKRVYIVGGKQFTSTVLQRNCHEFISYESLMDLLPTRGRRSGLPQRGRQQRSLPLNQALSLIDRALEALEVRGVQPQLGLLKSTMLQLDPAFTERDYGVSAFSTLIEKLEEQGHIQVRTVDNHQVVDRPARAADAIEEDAEPALSRDDALVELQDVLTANVSLLEIGIPEREVEAIMRAAAPDFEEETYGFTEFGEVLNYACDKGVLRSEADSSEQLRYLPGPDLHKKLDAEQATPPKPADEAPETRGAEQDLARDGSPSAGRRRRRRRGRRSGRGRGSSVTALSEVAPDLDEIEPLATGEPQQPIDEDEPPVEGGPEPREEASPDDERGGEPEPPKKKTARKKATKKSAKKKASKKKAARKASKKASAD